MTGTVYRTEAEWMVDVRATAGRFGWLCWHHLRSEGTRAGLPDLELVHPARVVHARVELKTDRHDSHLSPAQVVTLDVLARCCPDSWLFVWRPSDRDEIDEILSRLGRHERAHPPTLTSWREPERRIREVRRLSDSELRDVIRIGRDSGILYRTTDPALTPEFR